MDDATRAQLSSLADALAEQLDAAENEVRARVARLKDVRDALGASEAVEAVSTSATAQWYATLEQFFYAQP